MSPHIDLKLVNKVNKVCKAPNPKLLNPKPIDQITNHKNTWCGLFLNHGVNPTWG